MAKYTATRDIYRDGVITWRAGDELADGDLPALAIDQLVANRGLRLKAAPPAPPVVPAPTVDQGAHEE